MNRMRWRWGDTNPVVAIPKLESTIEIGDLIYLANEVVAPASFFGKFNKKEVGQKEFKDYFLGVAMQSSKHMDDSPIRIATSGYFEFDCVSSAFCLGDLIGVEANSQRNMLLNQIVVKVNKKKLAIGRVGRMEQSKTTKVIVDIVSTIMKGGV